MTTVDVVYLWGSYSGTFGGTYTTFTTPELINNLGTGGQPSALGQCTFVNGENGWFAFLCGGMPYATGGNDYNNITQIGASVVYVPSPICSPDSTTAFSWAASVGATPPFHQIEGGNHWAWINDNNGHCFGWGRAETGELGNNNTSPTTTSQPIPIQVYGIGDTSGATKLVVQNKFGALSGGAQHMAALLLGASVACCGDNEYGQCGDGVLPAGTTTQYNVPTVVVAGAQGGTNLSNIQYVSCGNVHSLGLDSGGSVWGWGQNTHCQLGDGTTNNRSSPVAPAWPGAAPSVTAISGGGGFSDDGQTLVITSDGNLWAWGANLSGQCGLNTLTSPITTPQQVQLGPVVGQPKVVQASSGAKHALALLADGSLWGWGLSTYLGAPSLSSNILAPTRLWTPGIGGITNLPSAGTINKIWAGNETSVVDITVPVVATVPTTTRGQSGIMLA